MDFTMRLAAVAPLLCAALGAPIALAQDKPRTADPVASATAVAPEGLDSHVERIMARHHVPGVSVAVVKDGEVVLARGYGLANVELGVPASADTVYQLAS